MNAVPYRSVLHIVFDRKENNEVLKILPFKAELKSLSTLWIILCSIITRRIKLLPINYCPYEISVFACKNPDHSVYLLE